MPRKATKTAKPSLLFLERPLCGARLQNVPEVRAALHPRGFFTETQTHNSTALNSWVSPQFDSSHTAAPTVRRGRRKCQSATSILESCSQLSRKNSVCKFPSLSFHTRSRDQPRPVNHAYTKKATNSTVVSDTGNQPQGSCQVKRTVSNAQFIDTPKRQWTSIRKRRVERPDGGASSGTSLDQPESLSVQVTERCRIPDDASTSTSSEASSVDLPPDVDTPKSVQGGRSSHSFPSGHLLLPQPCTPPCGRPPDILVANTPERDYGLKVTWRRRRGLMLLLKERGHLFDSDVLTADVKNCSGEDKSMISTDKKH